MEPDIKRELEEIRALVKDNHRMLKAMRRDQWISFFGRVIVWVIVLLLPLYLYQQYLWPIVSQFSPEASKKSTGPFGLPSSTDIQKLINSYQAGSE